MNLQLVMKDVHGDTTPAMRIILKHKLGFLEKIIGDEQVKVTVSREGRGFNVIAQFDMAGKLMKINSGIFASAYEAIDVLVNRVKENVKDKRNEAKHPHGERNRVEAKAELMELDEQPLPTGSIVERKKFATKPMSEAGAIAEMEMLGHDSFIFINSESEDRVCMLYTRRAGGYGLIELE